MIDLILRAGTKAAIATFLRNRGLTDAENRPVEGFEACWWADTGKVMSAKPVLDANGNITTPPNYLAGFVLITRIHGSLFNNDRLDGEGDQWLRSKIAKWIKDNGTPGTAGGIRYYEIQNVRLFRPEDVNTWLAANDLPGHEWAGGNAT